MRVIGRSILVALLLTLALVAVRGLPLGGSPVAGVTVVNAASPSPSAGTGGDTRTAGEGPGLVGAPVLAVLGVLGLGLLTAIVTTVYVRLSGERGRSE